MFITCIVSYSKYLVVKEIQNNLNIDTKISEILQHFHLLKLKWWITRLVFHQHNLNPSHKDAVLIYILRILAIVRPMYK